jgi:phenylacetyl-CoA:acceptor oxidoreductase 26-kDa subunit
VSPFVYGPAPWRQRNWDWRAAANFICGGAGSGLLISTAIAAPPAPLRTALLLVATVAISIGLLCVWFEIGRPKRALNVFLNPFTSWMTREALFATALVPAALLAAAGVPFIAWIAAGLALAFLVCQAYMLRAAKGIPAWRSVRTPPLVIATGLTEGAGLFAAAVAWTDSLSTAAWLGLGLLVAVRAVLWQAWRGTLRTQAAPRALASIDRTGRWLLLAGTAAPLAALALGLALQGDAAGLLRATAGLLAAATGLLFKFDLLGGAAFNQGFTLAHLPVRGARR